MPVEPYGGEQDWENDLDLENRMVEPAYLPEDQEVEDPCVPGLFRNTSARIRPRKI